MKLTDRMKWGIATVAIPILAAALLYVYAILPEKEDIPPATGEVRDVAPSWIDRAFSAYYEKKTDEPIVAIIRQDIPGPDRGHLARREVHRHRGEHHPRRGDLERCGKARSSGSSRSIPET